MRSVHRVILKILVGLFAFPVFSVLTVGLFICAIVSSTAGLLRTFGFKLEMNIAMYEVPRLLSLPFALLFGVLFFYLAILSWKTLRLSYRFLMR